MSQKTAIKVLLWLSSGVILFHICIILKLLPYEITWGGRIKNDAEMYVFESISILINVFLIFILLIKGSFIKRIMPLKIVNGLLWTFLVLFGLNTIGNIVAKTNLEQFFSLLTLSFFVLILIVLKK